MTLKELLETLPADQQTSVADFISSAVEAEKQIGIKTHQKQNRELQAKDEKLKDFWNKEEETFEEAVARFNKTKESAKTGELTIAQLSDRLGDMESKFSNSETKRISAEEKISTTVINETLTKEFGGKYHGGKYMISNAILSKELKVAEDGKVVPADGSSIADYFTSKHESEKDNLISNQVSGTGTLKNNNELNNKQTSSGNQLLDALK